MDDKPASGQSASALVNQSRRAPAEILLSGETGSRWPARKARLGVCLTARVWGFYKEFAARKVGPSGHKQGYLGQYQREEVPGTTVSRWRVVLRVGTAVGGAGLPI